MDSETLHCCCGLPCCVPHTGQPKTWAASHTQVGSQTPATLILVGCSTDCSGVCAGRQEGLKGPFLQLPPLGNPPSALWVESGMLPLYRPLLQGGHLLPQHGKCPGGGSNFFPLEQGRQTWRAPPCGITCRRSFGWRDVLCEWVFSLPPLSISLSSLVCSCIPL